jgi:formylglycine-generating enzyme required for sulfatase activity
VANVADVSAKPLLPWADGDLVGCDDHRAALAPVGSYTANAYGLNDMSGNVWEWTWDTYGDYPAGSATDPTGATEGPFRVSRGGSWLSPADHARAALRGWFSPGLRRDYLGLRLSRTIP